MEKIALVTGSSRGIGRAVAAGLARQGWAVCINYRVRENCARSLLEQLTAEGCRAMMVRADVSQRDQVEAMVRRVEDTFGPVSLLVNNAGVAGQACSRTSLRSCGAATSPSTWTALFTPSRRCCPTCSTSTQAAS